jgi:hypothetical protein
MSFPNFEREEAARPCMVRKKNGRFLGESPTYFDKPTAQPPAPQLRPTWDGESCTQCIMSRPLKRRRIDTGYPITDDCKCELEEDRHGTPEFHRENQARLDAYSQAFQEEETALEVNNIKKNHKKNT